MAVPEGRQRPSRNNDSAPQPPNPGGRKSESHPISGVGGRLPEGTGLDVLPLQRQANGRARGAELRGIHGDAGESAEQVVSVTALADQKLRQGGYVWYSAGGSATSTFAA